jgi:hypothetical protein
MSNVEAVRARSSCGRRGTRRTADRTCNRIHALSILIVGRREHARSATVRGKAVFGCPHRALSKESSAQQGITSDSSDSRTSRIGSQSSSRAAGSTGDDAVMLLRNARPGSWRRNWASRSSRSISPPASTICSSLSTLQAATTSPNSRLRRVRWGRTSFRRASVGRALRL